MSARRAYARQMKMQVIICGHVAATASHHALWDVTSGALWVLRVMHSALVARLTMHTYLRLFYRSLCKSLHHPSRGHIEENLFSSALQLECKKRIRDRLVVDLLFTLLTRLLFTPATICPFINERFRQQNNQVSSCCQSDI